MRLPQGWQRFPLVTVLSLGWLGGGLVSAAVAAFVDKPNDGLYAAVNITGAVLSLLLLAAAGPRLHRRRRRADSVPNSGAEVRVPAQTRAGSNDRPSPARVTEPAGRGGT